MPQHRVETVGVIELVALVDDLGVKASGDRVLPKQFDHALIADDQLHFIGACFPVVERDQVRLTDGAAGFEAELRARHQRTAETGLRALGEVPHAPQLGKRDAGDALGADVLGQRAGELASHVLYELCERRLRVGRLLGYLLAGGGLLRNALRKVRGHWFPFRVGTIRRRARCAR